MQADYRRMTPLDPDGLKAAVHGLRQSYVPVLTDGAFANQLAIVRGHGKEGFMTVVLDPDPSALAFYSRFAMPVQSPDYMSTPDDYWSFVLQIGESIRDAGKTPVLTVGDADYLLDSMMDFGPDRLAGVFAINQDYRLQQRLMDKYLQYRMAMESGLPVPSTWLADEAFLQEKPDLDFPVLVKERRGRKLFRQTGKQAFEAGSWEALEEILKASGQPGELLVQEKITDGGNENMYSIGAYCSRKRRPVAFFSALRLRPTRQFGSSVLSESSPCPDGVEMMSQFLKKAGYYGSCEMEFIYDSRRGQLLFLELNNRMYKIQSLATHCGINFNHLALLDAMEKSTPKPPQQMYGPKWWLPWSDIAMGIRKISRGEQSFREWVAPLSFDFVNGIDELDDPLPGFVNLFRGKF